jgi:hypothetical protein
MGSLQTFSRAESQQYAKANRLYGSENPERPPPVNIRYGTYFIMHQTEAVEIHGHA